jgi:hypothetical protein
MGSRALSLTDRADDLADGESEADRRRITSLRWRLISPAVGVASSCPKITWFVGTAPH